MAETHFPTRNGPWCGRDKRAISVDQPRIDTPTDARSYDVENPTCPTCALYVKRSQIVDPEAAARQPVPSRASLKRNE
jgi:hypothetical protein